MKVQNPIIGRARGSAGGMTFCKNYDKNVARAKAFEVSNPNTQAQQTQRNFFSECLVFCSQFSEEMLRTLFGVKPKSKSRRNALLGQFLECYTYSAGAKKFDAFKLQSIGNGQKVNTPFFLGIEVSEPFPENLEPQMFNASIPSQQNVYFVGMNEATQKYTIIDTGVKVSEVDQFTQLDEFGIFEGSWVGYFTTTVENKDTHNQPMGSFIIKTRAV